MTSKTTRPLPPAAAAAWPDPNKPGFPANAERDGEHWVQDDDGPPTRQLWLAAQNLWRTDDDASSAADYGASPTVLYFGPCSEDVPMFKPMNLFAKKPADPTPPPAPADMAAIAARLAEARSIAAAATVAREEAEAAMHVDIVSLTPAAFAARRSALVKAREAEADAAAMVQALEAAAEAEKRHANLRRVHAIAEELAAMTPAATEAAQAYLAAARAAWDAAREIDATWMRCANLTSELHAIWTNEIAASYGQMPRLGVELPDLGSLRLPAAGADGATLADPRGLEMDAGWHFAQVNGARRTSHMGGVRQGLKIAAAARGR